ncbi:unnamed protein product [Leptidea sinapis]|uniref:Myosin motor domain-containing protein n=1 Tax=Leptidea sinapis TaxID=189913 RepID=A0A5E4Q9J8_9NEOP|nr:unnamed protein product [Leptidea sinapis]
MYKGTLIGVLDIYGFEIFDTNSFEQFCINYCNEKLQQLFIELVLKQEQEEYAREGIQWTPIQYFNNRIICELVEAPHQGIIAIMDEACLNPTQLAPADKKMQHGVHFRITLPLAGPQAAVTLLLERLPARHTSKRPPSAASLFRSSMSALVSGLQSKEPFYVRCVRHQVAYLGLVENVRVRRAGFASRQRYDRFLKRYKMLSQYTWPNFRGSSDKDAVMVLLRDLHVTDVQFGHTKLFIRSAKTIHGLEAARAELIPSIVVLLQKLWRGTLARIRYRKLKAALVIFNAWKAYRFRRYISSLQHELARHRGVIKQWPGAPRGLGPVEPTLQAAYRRWRAHLVLRDVPRDQWDQLKLKICAASALASRRPRWGADRLWEGDYLADFDYNPKAALYKSMLSSMQRAQNIGKAIFSCGRCPRDEQRRPAGDSERALRQERPGGGTV